MYKVNSPGEFFHAYDQTRDLCMTLQTAVNFKEYFRCYCVGQQKVHIMQYDPSLPFHERYVKNPAPVDPKLLERVERDCLTLCRALGYDLNTVEFACEDGIPYAIDFMNPAPDADIHSVGQANFDWIVNQVAELAMDKARKHTGKISEYRWSAFLGGPPSRFHERSKSQAGQPGGTRMNRPSFSIGIEEEYQTIDPETRDLRSHIQSEILPKAKLATMDRAKPELHQSVVEVGTKVCRDIQEAREDILDLRRQMITLTSESGMWLAAASTHPFANWRAQEIHPDDRYKQVVEDLQLVARANLVFGLHIHVGIEDRNTAIHIMNSMRYFLPHILALSSNSPFWEGDEDGIQVVSVEGVRTLPAHQYPRRLCQLGGVRDVHQPADQDQLRRQRQEGLVGHSPPPVFQYA